MDSIGPTDIELIDDHIRIGQRTIKLRDVQFVEFNEDTDADNDVYGAAVIRTLNTSKISPVSGLPEHEDYNVVFANDAKDKVDELIKKVEDRVRSHHLPHEIFRAVYLSAQGLLSVTK